MAVAGGAGEGLSPPPTPHSLGQGGGPQGEEEGPLPDRVPRAHEHPGHWRTDAGQRGHRRDEQGGPQKGGWGGGEQRRDLRPGLRPLHTLPAPPQPPAGRQSSCGCSQLPGSPHLAGCALTSCRPGCLEGGKNNPPPPPAGGRRRRILLAWRRPRPRPSRSGGEEPP